MPRLPVPVPDLLSQDRVKAGSLTFAEREQIGLLVAQGFGVNEIGRELGRAGSTISRELHRVTARMGHGRASYVASVSQAHADRAARRPKVRKLATNARLRGEVRRRLKENHSPEQISARLVVDFPDDEEMRVSHETIYQALFVQGRGGLTRELTRHLRSGRQMRQPGRETGQRGARIVGMLNISHRPAEAKDRAVPGHWEGDLILGSTASGSAIGTLVERTTGFTVLLHLQGDHSAATVAAAMVTAMGGLPELLWRSLTWDQGSEMARHAQITAQTGLAIYFCDPHSPWQRPSNENTNGLLRQYFPKGTDLSLWGPGYLEVVAAELNARPRKRLGWKTPAEELDRLLSEATKTTGVADTA